MADITDKFGKASVETDYALATTVKTARTEGESVLACYDLSRFAQDTPVFFVTYKKTTDPTTDEVTVTNQTSWKGLVNPDNNTLTNLTLAPGYEDIGNDIGDFVECIPTSFWGNELVDGLFVSMNPDGTLKAEAIRSALDLGASSLNGWDVLGTTSSNITHHGNMKHTIRFTGIDYTGQLSKGTRLRFPRSTPVGEKSTDFNATGYGTKSSPAGYVFTQFTVESWVYVEGYPSVNSTYFIGRRNTTEGWMVRLNPDGQIEAYAANAGAGWDTVRTTVPIPRNRWVHIAVKINPATTSGEIYFNGVKQAATYSNGTATSIAHVAAAPLSLGCEFITGAAYAVNAKMRDLRLWSSARTQDEIRDNMNNELTGTEPDLVGYWKLHTDLNDSTANANHFVAGGGLTPGGDSETPMHNVEYAFVYDKPTYSGGNTEAVIVTGNESVLPTNYTSTAYSIAHSPLGLPEDLQESVYRYQDYNGYEILDYGGYRTASRRQYFELTALAAGAYASAGFLVLPADLRGTYIWTTSIRTAGNAPFNVIQLENSTIYVRNVSGGTSDIGTITVDVMATERA